MTWKWFLVGLVVGACFCLFFAFAIWGSKKGNSSGHRNLEMVEEPGSTIQGGWVYASILKDPKTGRRYLVVRQTGVCLMAEKEEARAPAQP